MNFSEYAIKARLLEDIDLLIDAMDTITESSQDDTLSGVANTIDSISSESVQAILSALAGTAKYLPKKGLQLGKLMTPSGLQAVKKMIKDDFIDSSTVTYLKRKWQEPDRYKKFAGLEQYIDDMKEDRPDIVDSLKKLLKTIVM